MNESQIALILELADAYAETRHKCGSHLYNATTNAARAALESSLRAGQEAQEPVALTALKYLMENYLYFKGGLSDKALDIAAKAIAEAERGKPAVESAPEWMPLMRDCAQALDDWCTTYAHDFCDEESVRAAWDRIGQHGGTIAYIADLTKRVSDMCPDEVVEVAK